MVLQEQKRVLLAFSGGIDSCAAVNILRDMGYEVEALTINMMGDAAMLQSARESAQRLMVKLHIYDGRELFEREIIGNFISEYQSGRTPAPCTRCNTLIKWEVVAEVADQLGIHYIATGHYFRLERDGERCYVARAKDPIKDQSYYLWGVRQELLARALSPMGDRIKEEVKKVSDIKRESMGICFLHGRHYTDILVERCGEMASGQIVDRDNRVVGHHNGIARYTIGQKRGEGIPSGLRVVEILAERNQLRVDLNERLNVTKLYIDNCHFVDPDGLDQLDDLRVVIRGLGLNPQCRATIKIDNPHATIELHGDHAWAAAPGQPIVLYSGSRVVGGGYLVSAE